MSILIKSNKSIPKLKVHGYAHPYKVKQNTKIQAGEMVDIVAGSLSTKVAPYYENINTTSYPQIVLGNHENIKFRSVDMISVSPLDVLIVESHTDNVSRHQRASLIWIQCNKGKVYIVAQKQLPDNIDFTYLDSVKVDDSRVIMAWQSKITINGITKPFALPHIQTVSLSNNSIIIGNAHILGQHTVKPQGVKLAHISNNRYVCAYSPSQLGATYMQEYELYGEDIKFITEPTLVYPNSGLKILSLGFTDTDILTLVTQHDTTTDFAKVKNLQGMWQVVDSRQINSTSTQFVCSDVVQLNNKQWLCCGTVNQSVNVRIVRYSNSYSTGSNIGLGVSAIEGSPRVARYNDTAAMVSFGSSENTYDIMPMAVEGGALYHGTRYGEHGTIDGNKNFCKVVAPSEHLVASPKVRKSTYQGSETEILEIQCFVVIHPNAGNFRDLDMNTAGHFKISRYFVKPTEYSINGSVSYGYAATSGHSTDDFIQDVIIYTPLKELEFDSNLIN